MSSFGRIRRVWWRGEADAMVGWDGMGLSWCPGASIEHDTRWKLAA
jgi:hypothetical protein